MVKMTWLKIWTIIKGFFKWCTENYKFVLTILGIIVLILSIILVRQCYINRNIDKTRDEIIKEQIEANRLERNAKEKERESNVITNKANETLENVNKIESENKNVSVDEANRNRCKTFPNSNGC